MEQMLLEHPLFVVLPPEERDQLRELAKVQTFSRGTWIFQQGEPAVTVWVLLEGWVHLVRTSTTGRRVTIFTLTPADALCGISAFEHGTYTAGAMAATNCRLAALPGKYVAALLERHPTFAREVLALERLRIRHMAEAICRAHDPVECRIAYMLLQLGEQFGAVIPVTHRELAQMAHTTLETSIRVTSKLRQQGLVETRRGRFTIRQPAQLQSLAAGNGNGHARVA